MGSFLLETNQKDLPPWPHPFPSFPTQSPPPPALLSSNLENKISPSVLLIIVILAVIFFISGLLHLLVRYLIRATNRDPEDLENVTALQGQLQQLFHLHDAGVDQSFIDNLPIFLYKAIIGLKDPFDCAVCLCEFEADDKLRLLPKCSHAFHLECIDTWLLSHSTCPLCRSSLLPDFSSNNGYSPVVLVLQSGNESSRESVSERVCRETGLNSHLGLPGEEDHWSSTTDISQKAGEAKEEASPTVLEEKVVPVKLGKYRNVDVGAGEGEGSSNNNNNNNLDERRCFSMGSFEYVMDESSLLHVAIKPPTKKPSIKNPGHRLTMSECDCHSRRDGFKGFDPSTSDELRRVVSNGRITSNPPPGKESFSISKIWLRSKEGKRVPDDVSRRAFSFRWPMQRGASEDLKVKSGRGSTASEFEAAGWDKSGSELGFDAESGSCNGRMLSRADEAPSFARRALLWIAGRHHKVVNHV